MSRRPHIVGGLAECIVPVPTLKFIHLDPGPGAIDKGPKFEVNVKLNEPLSSKVYIGNGLLPIILINFKFG